jgi:8-oxo-dGTP pyrophosphatase MutT (NUDIX family)
LNKNLIRNGIFNVARLETAFCPEPWDFALDHAERIDAHWRRSLAKKPKLFDGKVLLLRHAEFFAGPTGLVFRGAFFDTNFRNFLAWRDFGFPDGEVFNCFSMAALRSSDGAWLLGESGAHTMNSGKIYFAAGTPDLNDVFGDRVDLNASVAREMREETGFSADEAPVAAGWRLVVDGQKIACMQERRLAISASEACAKAAAHIAGDPDPELARLHAVRSSADMDAARMPEFTQIFLRNAFASEAD